MKGYTSFLFKFVRSKCYGQRKCNNQPTKTWLSVGFPTVNTDITRSRFFATNSILIIAFLYCCQSTIHAQPGVRDIIQFSGIVITDSLQPIPLVNIIIKNTYRGTISDFYGFFSVVARELDTIEFSSIGYKREKFVIPDSLSYNRYSLIQILRRDTVLLKETFIYPWPTKEQFKEAFLNMNIPDDDLARAEKNLERSEMKDRMENLTMDGSMNYKNYMQQQTSRLYYAGQYPPNNLLNPIAWIKFIELWRSGAFSNKKE